MEGALNINSTLCNELLHMVFTWLPPQDRISATLVCRSWENVISHPKFWAWVAFRVDYTNIDQMPHVLGFKRLAAVREMSLYCYDSPYTGTIIWQNILFNCLATIKK